MTQATGHHEDFAGHDAPKMGSPRSFGVVFAVCFAVIGLWPLIGGEFPRWWSLAVSAVFLGLAWLAPHLLTPLNTAWLKFGGLLHRITNPIIMGLVFFTVVVPMGLVFRLIGKDLLARSFDDAADSYWVERSASKTDRGNMRQQF